MEERTPFYKAPWFIGGLVALAVFVLCFKAIDYIGSPDDPDKIDVKEEVIATALTNPELLALARSQGWIAADAQEMTSIDAANVKALGTALQNSPLKHFDELRHFLAVKELPAGTFAGSNSLESIVVPRSVVTIEYGAFADCPALTSLSVDTANTHYDSREDCNGVVCTWKGKLMLVAGCRTTRIVDGIRYIAPQAFRGTTGLAEITLPEKMDEIGVQAFRDCSALTSFAVPQGVRFVEDSTFMGCTSLQTVTLSKSVERLRKDAFKGCSALSRIVCIKKYPPIVEDAFDARTATLVVPQGMRNTYRDSKYWKGFSNVVEE